MEALVEKEKIFKKVGDSVTDIVILRRGTDGMEALWKRAA